MNAEKKTVEVIFKPMNITLKCESGISVLEAEHLAGIRQDAPCGGHGICGKCLVKIKDKEIYACQVKLYENTTVWVQSLEENVQILTQSTEETVETDPVNPGKYIAAVDIGTTTMVCYLMDGTTGRKITEASMLNPQFQYGMDVISRIQASLKGDFEALVTLVRKGVSDLIERVLSEVKASPGETGTICIVGNPAMQQLFMKILPDNLAAPPFSPALRKAEAVPAANYLPSLTNAKLLIIPDISGYVGADTVAGVISTGLYKSKKMILMIDIGTNGEIVLGNETRMLACSTAAGPALEGARISCGMRGAEGAVDHVHSDAGKWNYSVIGGGKAKGICGSGLIDFVAALLENGQINKRGRIQKDYEETDGVRKIFLDEDLCLTQEDIREVQMAKGAIAAGILLLTREMGITLADIDEVILAGAFGSYITPRSACRIGLIPAELLPKIHAVGNAAGMGSRMMALNRREFMRAEELVNKIEPVELAALPDFQRTFGRCTSFET